VVAWSTAPIQFEPGGWRLDFRRDLRLAVAKLPLQQRRSLSATYTSAVSEGADVENLLIYNVFNAEMSQAARDGFTFERIQGVPPDCPMPLSSQALCRYEYRLVGDQPTSLEAEGQVLASSRFELPARVPESPTVVWYAAKIAGVVAARGCDATRPWGILISMRVPYSSHITCSSIVKPFIDGIASALHFHDGSDIGYLSRQLGAHLGLNDSALVKALLLDDTNAVFGKARLLCRHKNSVQWNPGDEHCI